MSTITIDKEEFEKFYRKSVADFTKKYLFSDYYKYVISQTSFLDEVYKDVKLWQRRYHIINGIDHILTCPLCGRPRAIKTDRVGYMKTCDNPICIGQGRSLSKKKSDKEKYGTDNYFTTEEYKQKSRQTCLKKYGVDHVAQAKEVKDKIKQSVRRKYGVDYYTQTEEHKKKIQETCLKKYGATNIVNSKRYKDKLEDINKKKKQTCIERYGSSTFVTSNQFKENQENIQKKYKETNIKKYGVDNYTKTEEFQSKLVENFKAKLEEFGYFDRGYKFLGYAGDGHYKMHCPHCNNDFILRNTYYFYNRNKINHEICTNCNPPHKGYSIAEKELLDYVSSIYSGTIIENDRSAIAPYELDIYLPDLCLAIEFNGLYWHSNEQKPNNYHRMKSDLCKEKGVHLIHVFEDDWVNKQSIIKSVISNFVNNTVNRRIYARKCEVRAISDKTLINNFLVSNHLLGRTTFISYCAGLYYNDELVSLITMHLLKKAERKWELNRYAIKNGVTIIGGAERLLKHIIQTIDYSLIITYNDNSIFRGLVYKRLGFQYVRTNAPNYMFIQGDCLERFPKQTIRKWNVGYSREMEQQLGLHRVYNAGNDVYVLNK